MGKKYLDYMLVPNSTGKIEKRRMSRAKEEMGKRGIGEVLVMRGKNSNEDILYLGKILKGNEKIGIVTFPLHFKEYQEIIRKAKRDGKFPKKITAEGILTKQTLKEFIYGWLGLGEEKIFGRKVDYENNENKFRKFVKNIVKKIIGLGR